MSGIDPIKLGKDLSKKNCIDLVLSIKDVLKKSIKLGGSSINDHTMISGKIGYFQNKLQVYGREGLKCRKRSCQSSILRIVIAQRSTFYCAQCQKWKLDKNMANTKSAKGKIREITKKTDINKSVRNRYRTYIKKVELNIVKGDKAQAKEALRSAESEIMSAVSKKIVHKNTASRKISRLASQIKSLK